MTHTWTTGARDGLVRLDGAAPEHPGRPIEIVLFDHRKDEIGWLRFRACRACRTGRIMGIWISEDQRRQGLGSAAVHSLLALHPGWQWTTSAKSREGRAFFSTVEEDTATDFPTAGPLCPHLRGGVRRLLQRVIGSVTERPRDEDAA